MKDLLKLDISNIITYNQIHQDIQENPNSDIAIIGIGARLPLADNIEEFWENIKNGVDSTRDFPENRKRDVEPFLREDYKGNSINIKYQRCSYLDNIDEFDYDFFKLTPIEANLMNPTQRIFLETAWKSIEDSGYGGEKLKGSNTGVYLGFIGDLEGYKYKQIISEFEPKDSNSISMAGNLSAIIPSRISYMLDLKGPSMSIDTACSSSLVAIHLACQSIRNGDCEQAIAGGIRISLLPVDDGSEIGMESPDSTTRAFDDNSNGTSLGEGVVALFLKPLYKAREDRDNIYAIIKGSAINQDGTTMGITSPNALAQADVIKRSWKNAGINPETISYIEAHGTGTKLGDPIEIQGLKTAFEEFTDKKQFCAIGSVKTNIGHLFEAAGIASMLKVILALNKKEIPPTNHFNTPNSKINFVDSPVYVNDKLRKWDTGDTPRRCGVSSFGFSGTNCHIVLEEAPQTVIQNNDIVQEKFEFFAISAKRKEGIKELLEEYISLLSEKNEIRLKDICYTANTGRGHYSHRLIILANSKEDLIEKIDLLYKRGIDIETDNVFYGEHRILFTKKENPDKNELTANMKNELGEAVKIKINDFFSSDKDDLCMMKEICSLYVKGVDIDWDRIYIDEPVKKVSLPTYPFNKQRCWINFHKADSSCKDSRPSYFEDLIVKIENYLSSASNESKSIEDGLIDIEKYGQLLLLKVLRENGVFLDGRNYEINSIKDKLGIIGKYERFFNAIINILTYAGFIAINTDTNIICPKIDEVQLESDFINCYRTKIIDCYSDKKAYLELLEACMANLKNILSGDVSATSVIFPNSSTQLVENIYRNNKNADFFNNLVSLSIKSFIELQEQSNLDTARKIKIVEIGAGTGGTSDSVIKSISSFSKSIEYNYTDISKGFTDFGKSMYGKDHPWVKFKELNVEKPIEKQGFEKNDYDIVMASNVIHATSNIKRTLKEVNKLLKINGILVLNEITKVHDFTTLTFGLLDGWWLFEDSDLRIQDSPLLRKSNWEKILIESGFGNVKIVSVDQEEGREGSLSLIIAEKLENAELEKNEHIHDSNEIDTNSLLGKCKVVSMFNDIYTNVFNPDRNWILSEHVVAGRYVVPGTAYLEMAQKAGKAYYKSSYVELRDVALVKPLTIRRGEYREVHTILQKNNECLEFIIASKSEEVNSEIIWTEHAKGKVYKLEEKKTANISIDSLILGYQFEEYNIDPNKNTQEFIKFGPRWVNCVRQLYDDKATLADIQLPDKYLEDLDAFDLHPALFDMALNAKSFKLQSKYLPLAYKSIKVYNSLPQKFYSHIVKKNHYNEKDDTIEFDISIYDYDGAKIVEIEGYSIRKIHNIEAVFGDDNLFSAVKWIEKPTEHNGFDYKDKAILLLKSDEPVCSEISKTLESYGNKIVDCSIGLNYLRVDDNEYAISSDIDGFAKLSSVIDFNKIDAVMHLQSITGDREVLELEDLDGQLEKGVKSLFCIFQNLINCKKNGNLDIFIVSDYINKINESDIKIHPWNGCLFGLAKSLAKEYPNFYFKCIDIDNKTSSDDILSEISSRDEYIVASYRNGIRYVDEIDLLDINSLAERKFELKDKGVYIITGGTGGIGIETSKYLSSHNKINIALINRSEMPERCQWERVLQSSEDLKLCRIIRGVLEIEANGSKVQLISADITNLNQMKQVIDQLRNQYGSINGIMHSAGVFGKGLIYTKEWNDFERVLKPKVQGTWILDHLTRSDDLDFFIMFSSAVSVFGVAGQTDYVAANAFMDSYSTFIQKHRNNAITINWPAWKDIGMAFDEGVITSSILEAINADKAMYGFDRVFKKELSNVMIGEWNYSSELFEQISTRVSDTIIRKMKQKRNDVDNNSEVNIKSNEVTLKGRSNGEYTETEYAVARVWGDVLGFESINIYDDLYALGCDSILAMKIVNNLNKTLSQPANISDVFNNPTISDFARYYDEKQVLHKKSDVEIIKDYEKVEESLISSNMLDIEAPKIDDSDFDF